uniref:non-specific serine/threonine protein kinase n=1 Tax=Equus asinus asinus TaxID=83772 RepID=A0A8C4MNM3_EQUAS
GTQSSNHGWLPCSCSMVRRGRHIPTGTAVAVKVIPAQERSFSGTKELLCKVHSLKALCHPNIIALLEVTDTEHKLYLVVEHVRGGDLYHHLVEHARGPFHCPPDSSVLITLRDSALGASVLEPARPAP